MRRQSGYAAEMVWNSTRNLSNYAVPGGMTQIRDLAGNTSPISNGVVSVGNSPILIETAVPVP